MTALGIREAGTEDADSANAAAMTLYDSLGARRLDSKRFYRLDRHALRRTAGIGTATEA